ncbi:uncharacterized protein AMSG_09927 [Thecamonas trahens ATCC 50062]|uniref:Uncharacterized protein n=1 Tax=Thecamonas trahens ATCC 50062 TaxID=461836 RepID=A0A0L0DRU6_THETB|nr:hypothetical protein AMSG_09927 [Thecamonas trahens ATCC 50062]KNC54148.1 hypothetical protein AMSG_09927 [Thecamonas trahens ATCC 50062]|eukprot:XP_013753969.1 hypothetical protein AMSG_09927 [Thecamonas trahens ATCC 50062]
MAEQRVTSLSESLLSSDGMSMAPAAAAADLVEAVVDLLPHLFSALPHLELSRRNFLLDQIALALLAALDTLSWASSSAATPAPHDPQQSPQTDAAGDADRRHGRDSDAKLARSRRATVSPLDRIVAAFADGILTSVAVASTTARTAPHTSGTTPLLSSRVKRSPRPSPRDGSDASPDDMQLFPQPATPPMRKWRRGVEQFATSPALESLKEHQRAERERRSTASSPSSPPSPSIFADSPANSRKVALKRRRRRKRKASRPSTARPGTPSVTETSASGSYTYTYDSSLASPSSSLSSSRDGVDSCSGSDSPAVEVTAVAGAAVFGMYTPDAAAYRFGSDLGFASALLVFVLEARAALGPSGGSAQRLSSLVHMVEARQPALHLHLLHIIASLPPDSELLNMAANLIFHFYPPEFGAADARPLTSARGVTLPPPFEASLESAVLRAGVAALLGAASFEANEAGMVLLTRWCVPNELAASAPWTLRELVDGMLAWFDNGNSAAAAASDEAQHARRQLESSYILPWIEHVAELATTAGTRVGLRILVEALQPGEWAAAGADAPNPTLIAGALARMAALVNLASPVVMHVLLEEALPGWLDVLAARPLHPAWSGALVAVFKAFHRIVALRAGGTSPMFAADHESSSMVVLVSSTLVDNPPRALSWLALLSSAGVLLSVRVFLSGLEHLACERARKRRSLAELVECADLLLAQVDLGAQFTYRELEPALELAMDLSLTGTELASRVGVRFVTVFSTLVRYTLGAKIRSQRRAGFVARAPLEMVRLEAGAPLIHWLYMLLQTSGSCGLAGAGVETMHAILIEPNYVSNKDELVGLLQATLLPALWRLLDVKYDSVSAYTYALLQTLIAFEPLRFDELLESAFSAPQWFMRYDAVEKAFGLFSKLKLGTEALAAFGAAFSRLLDAELDPFVQVRTKAYLELSSLDHDQRVRALSCLTALYNESNVWIQTRLLGQLVRFRRDFGSYQILPWVTVLQGLSTPLINLEGPERAAVLAHKSLLIEAAFEMAAAQVPMDDGTRLKLYALVASPLASRDTETGSEYLVVMVERLMHLLDVNLEVGRQFCGLVYAVADRVFAPGRARVSSVVTAGVVKLLLVTLFKYASADDGAGYGDLVLALRLVFRGVEHAGAAVMELAALVALTVLRTMPAVSVQLLYEQFAFMAGMIAQGVVCSGPRLVAYAYFYLEQALVTFADAGYYVILFSSQASRSGPDALSREVMFYTLATVLREGARRGLPVSLEQPVIDVARRLFSVPVDIELYGKILATATAYALHVLGRSYPVSLDLLAAILKFCKEWPGWEDSSGLVGNDAARSGLRVALEHVVALVAWALAAPSDSADEGSSRAAKRAKRLAELSKIAVSLVEDRLDLLSIGAVVRLGLAAGRGSEWRLRVASASLPRIQARARAALADSDDASCAWREVRAVVKVLAAANGRGLLEAAVWLGNWGWADLVRAFGVAHVAALASAVAQAADAGSSARSRPWLHAVGRTKIDSSLARGLSFVALGAIAVQDPALAARLSLHLSELVGDAVDAVADAAAALATEEPGLAADTAFDADVVVAAVTDLAAVAGSAIAVGACSRPVDRVALRARVDAAAAACATGGLAAFGRYAWLEVSDSLGIRLGSAWGHDAGTSALDSVCAKLSARLSLASRPPTQHALSVEGLLKRLIRLDKYAAKHIAWLTS